eukprot:GHVP01057978.1.p1 GENE.GHVP01057978.1~~GHVP01057978.1.p1  ORF type:complete len:135 (-),score=13.94 GHVP01057978.1:321-725(-)
MMSRIPRLNEISSHNIIDQARRAFFEIPNPSSINHQSQPNQPIHQETLPQITRSRSHSPSQQTLHLHEHEHHHNYPAEEEKESHTQQQPNAPSRIPKAPNPADYHQQHQAFDASIPYEQPRHPEHPATNLHLDR